MLSQGEMERKLDALSAQNTALQRRINDLEESTASHIGIDYGAAQQLSPHPNQQVQTAEYGGGAMRLSENGIQIKAATTGTKGIYFENAFSLSPDDDASVGWISGQGDAGGNFTLTIKAFNSDGDDARFLLRANTRTAALSAYLGVFSTIDSPGGAGINCSGSTDGTQDFRVSVSGKFAISAYSYDPEALVNPDMWYRSDLFRFRIRSNSITGNLGVEIQSAAANAVATGETIVTEGVSAARVAPAGAVTGVILAAGTTGGQMCQIVNQSAAGNTVTFAVAATSNVANGVTSVIAGLNARSFVWNSSTSLWYPCI